MIPEAIEEKGQVYVHVNKLLEEREKTTRSMLELERYKNIIDELEKDIKKEIKRTEELILEDGGLIEITNIRKMLNDERKNILFKLDKLKELKGSDK